MIAYSPSTKGFYVQGIHKEIPDDSILITESKHRQLLEMQSNGGEIQVKDGVVTCKPSQYHVWDGSEWIENTEAAQAAADDLRYSQFEAQRDSNLAALQVQGPNGVMFNTRPADFGNFSAKLAIVSDEDTFTWDAQRRVRVTVTGAQLRAIFEEGVAKAEAVWEDFRAVTADLVDTF